MISVILCGGTGSRLWPLSRKFYPKPFIRLRDGQTFLRKTILRGGTAPECDSLMIVANRALYFKTLEECHRAGIGKRIRCVLEPFGRNTAPAIAAAALLARREQGDAAPLLILPSDHLIPGQEAFHRHVSRALELAAGGKLVTFGIKPVFPHTGYGYIEAEGGRVVRFVEKPDRDTAARYVDSGRFLWNSGMFCFRAGAMIAEMRAHCPAVLEAVEACLDASQSAVENALELDEDAFSRVPDIAIDRAVFEKSANAAVVACDDIGWNDVGSWTELCALTGADAAGNHVTHPERAVLHDAVNCDIDNYSRLVAALGVENLMIIDTDDALLVADKSRAQDVRIIYERLSAENHPAHLQHPTVYTPWGYFTTLEEGTRFKIKRLVVLPGERISLQLHHHRSEHWIVVSGMAEVTCGERRFFVNTNESTYLKAGEAHRVSNPGKVDLTLIEVQSGDYLGEDDIVRFGDDYGRT